MTFICSTCCKLDQCLNCEKRSGGTLEARRRRRRDERRRRENRGAVGAEERGIPLPNRQGGLGSVVRSASGVRGGALAENEFGAFCGR